MMPKVMIVDDEAPVRRLMRRFLEANGAEVIEARDAEQALALMGDAGGTAVALCDMRMPGRDGLWLAEQLRGLYPQTAVVMTTGVHEFDAAVMSLQSGAVDYVSKPFTQARLHEALERGLRANASRRASVPVQGELEDRRADVVEALSRIELNGATSIDVILATLQARDPDASSHAHRVARLSVNLALALDVEEPILSDIERAALLHDVGRLALPEGVLSASQDSLSPAERALLRAHPLHGRSMVRAVPFLAAASDIAVAVHERRDGSGFPNGLRGAEIPFEARIVAVAHAYDELTSGAARPALPVAAALEILGATRTAEFDQIVVTALRTLLACTVPVPATAPGQEPDRHGPIYVSAAAGHRPCGQP